MSLSSSDIRLIVEALQESGWDQASVTVGDVRISVARNGLGLAGEGAAAPVAPIPAQPAALAPAVAAPSPTIAAPAPAPVVSSPAAADGLVDGHIVSAPSVGVFWRAPQPGAAPFVEVGARVSAGETLGIVEVMKLMNTISADVTGTVVGIHVPNAGAVEYGTPLFTIKVED